MSAKSSAETNPVRKMIREFFYVGVLTLIIVKGDIVLFDWLEFGDGKKTHDLRNVLLNALWTGGFAVIVIQVLVWTETAIHRIRSSFNRSENPHV